MYLISIEFLFLDVVDPMNQSAVLTIEPRALARYDNSSTNTITYIYINPENSFCEISMISF